MEEIIAEEAEIERKLKALKVKCKSNPEADLRSIKRPADIGVIASKERDDALRRNAGILEDLEIAAAKLHTKRLCPLEKKLNELKTGLGCEKKSELVRKTGIRGGKPSSASRPDHHEDQSESLYEEEVRMMTSK